MERKKWQIVINFREDPAAAPQGWDELPADLQERFVAALESTDPAPWKCRFGTVSSGEPLASALFTDVTGNTSLDAQIRADNLVKQALAALGDIPLALESCGVRLQ